MSNEILPDPDQLRETLIQAQSFAENFQALVKDQAVGTDQSGCVSVEVNSSGVLQRIEVTDQWSVELEPEALGGAVFEAYGQACQNLYVDIPEDQASLEKTTDSARESAVELMDPVLQVEAVEPTERRVEDFVESVLQQAERLTEFTSFISELPVLRTEPPVELVFENGGLVACEFDENWLSGASIYSVNGKLSSAVHQVQRLLGQRTQDIAQAQGRVGQDLSVEGLSLLRGFGENNG